MSIPLRTRRLKFVCQRFYSGISSGSSDVAYVVEVLKRNQSDVYVHESYTIHSDSGELFQHQRSYSTLKDVMKVLDKHNYIKVGQKPINIYTDRAWKAKATKLGVSKEWIKNAESKVWYNKHS